MYRVICMVLASVLCASAMAQQPERYPGRAVALEQEEAAYRHCLDSLYEEGEAAACTQWMALAACEMTYNDKKSSLESRVDAAKFAQYRAAALKAFPAYCDPMNWVNLALEALDADVEFDAKARAALWKQILERVGMMTPEQRLIVAREWVSSPDAADLWKEKAWKQFAIAARDDAKGLFPEISPAGVKFLSDALAIESARKAPGVVVDDAAKALLLLDAMAKHQYETARDLLMAIDANAIPATYREAIAEKIAPFAQAVFGKIRLADAVCYREFERGLDKKTSDAQVEARLNMLNLVKGKNRVGVLRYEAKERFERCQFDPVFRHFAEIWNAYPKDAQVIEFGDELVEFAENAGDALVAWRAVDVFHAHLQGAARQAFVERYGTRYANRIWILSQSVFEVQNIAKNSAKNSSKLVSEHIETHIRALKNSYELVAPSKEKNALALMLGRVYSLSGNRETARQFWTTIIDEAAGRGASSPVVAQAYRLMIRSLREDGKTTEAENLRARFVGIVP